MPAILAQVNLPWPRIKISEEYSEARKELTSSQSKREIILMDSISLVTEKDRDKIVVSGSHGGMLGKDPKTAMKHDAFAGFFHNGGIGKGAAGITRLAPLNERGIIAATVDGMSARIGDGVYNDVQYHTLIARPKATMSSWHEIENFYRQNKQILMERKYGPLRKRYADDLHRDFE